MKKGFIVIAVVLLITLYIMNKVNTAKQLEFTLGVPKNVRLDSGNLVFNLPLRAQNVTGTSIHVKSLDFDVLTANTVIGKALLTQAVTIAPNTFTEFNVSVSVGLFNVLTAAKSFLNLFKSGKVSLGLDGLIYAEGFQVPYAQTFELDYKNAL